MSDMEIDQADTQPDNGQGSADTVVAGNTSSENETAVPRAAGQDANSQELDSMGIPVICGGPLCSPNQHHPLCAIERAKPPEERNRAAVTDRGWQQWEGLEKERQDNQAPKTSPDTATEEENAQYEQAKQIAQEKASASYVQRKLRCSYNAAVRHLNRMVEEGILSTYSGARHIDYKTSGPASAAIQPPTHIETIELYGVRSTGDEDYLGKMPIPLSMKAQEFAQQYFCSFEKGDGSEADTCYSAIVAFSDWLKEQGRLTTPESPMNTLADILGMGSETRNDPGILFETVRNASRRSACLSRIESRYFTLKTDDDEAGEGGSECMLNWGDDPDEYERKFGIALNFLLAKQPTTALAQWDGKLSYRLQEALNTLRLKCEPHAVKTLEHHIREECEALYTSLLTTRHLYKAAQDRLAVLERANTQSGESLEENPEAISNVEMLDWDKAHEIAFHTAAAYRPPYFDGPHFVAHRWVVEAIRSAHRDGQRLALGLPAINRSAAPDVEYVKAREALAHGAEAQRQFTTVVREFHHRIVVALSDIVNLPTSDEDMLNRDSVVCKVQAINSAAGELAFLASAPYADQNKPYTDAELIRASRAYEASVGPQEAKGSFFIAGAEFMRQRLAASGSTQTPASALSVAANGFISIAHDPKPTQLANTPLTNLASQEDPGNLLHISQGAWDVLRERHRQIQGEGWSTEHDDEHTEGELSYAAAGYASLASDHIQAIATGIDDQLTLDDNISPPTGTTPWPADWQFKPCSPRRALVKSAALAMAELDRIDRASARQQGVQA